MQQKVGPNASDRRPGRSQRGRATGRQTQSTLQRARLWIVPLALGVMILLIGFLILRPTTQPTVAPISDEMAPEVGKLAPTFTLKTPDGSSVNLESLRGQVVLVNFWATWCPPCRAEMPAIQSAYTTYQDRGFTVVAVTSTEQPASVTAFVQEQGLGFPAVLDDGRVHGAYRATGLPASFFIDRQGVVRAIYRGAMSEAVITSELERLIVE